MIICLAALENAHHYFLNDIPDGHLDYGLVSFYYLSNEEHFEKILAKINKKIFIDSGAHSFQHGTKVDFDEYTKKYAEFIKKYTDNPKVEGFFEMDVDNVIGYEKVKELRSVLEAVSDKIIPVWHNNRGVDDFIEMCEKYSGRRIAITGFANNDIKDGQYNLFINEAHKHNCKIHVLGLTRFELIKTLNLGKYDSVDSSSWKQTGIFGGINLPTKDKNVYRVKSLEGLKAPCGDFITANYITARKLQLDYEDIDQAI